MSELAVAAAEAPLLNPVQRVVNTFAAPSKTFEDVRRSSGWWVPFLVAAVVGVLYAYVLLNKVGLPTLVEGVVHTSPALESRMASSTPEQAAAIRHSIETQFKFSYAAPVLSLLGGLAAAGVLLATANFGAGGRATFKQMLGVWFYGTLPITLFSLVVIAAIYGGVTGDGFSLKNPIGTNVGFYLTGSELPKALMPLLSAMDIFAVWTAWLLTIGVSTVAGIKRGAAAAVVFGWWILFILLSTAGAAFAG
jgi:hypothetical protein